MEEQAVQVKRQESNLEEYRFEIVTLNPICTQPLNYSDKQELGYQKKFWMNFLILNENYAKKYNLRT